MNFLKSQYKIILSSLAVVSVIILGVFYARGDLNDALQGNERLQTIAILFLAFVLIASIHALAGYWLYNRLAKRKG